MLIILRDFAHGDELLSEVWEHKISNLDGPKNKPTPTQNHKI